MELMVVVILIGILTTMAIPTMAEARYNAHTLDDATKIAEIYREGRTRAIARGAAMLMIGTSGNAIGGDLGTFTLWEGQIWGSGTVATPLLPLPGGSPVSSCGAPIAGYWATVTNATNAPLTQMDQVNMNTSLEQQAQIWSVLNDAAGVQTQTAVCYTPLGRTYYQSGTLVPVFTPGLGLLHGSLQFAVQRSDVGGTTPTGMTRTVIIPDSGATRIISR